jgi:predicted ribosomally synthesized peptide with SipW-like signal peptide
MSEKDTFDLSRRKVLAGLGTIGVASAGVGLGTSAYFSDEENFVNNSLVAGELDMKMGYSAHYSDWSPDEDGSDTETEDDDVDVVMWDGPPNTTGGPGDLPTIDGTTYTGLPTNAAWLIAVDSPGQFLENTQYAASGEASCDEFGTDAGDLDQPVINIEDVKPGDFGEVTFDFALCDNPGYVWLQGELLSCAENGVTEPEAKDEDENEDEPRPPENESDGASLWPLAALAGVPALGEDGGDEDDGLLSRNKALRAAAAGTAGLVGLSAATGSAAAQSGFDVVPKSASGDSATDLAESLVGQDSALTITSATYTGAGAAAGTFSGGNSLFGIDDGIILSSGAAENIEESAGGPDNNDDGITLDNDEPGDSDLLSLAQANEDPDITTSTNDACVLEFDFEVPEGEDQVFFNFVFGSDEYNEYAPGGANQLFNDVFGFFINPDSGSAQETNAATINGDPVSINTINQVTNTDLYNNNDPSDTNTPFATEADGFSDVLEVQADVNPGETNTFKLAIADANDFILDTWVLIEGESLSTSPEEPTEPEGECADVELLDVVQAAAWVDDGDNYQDGEEAPAIAGSLRDVLTELNSGTGLALAGDTPAEEGGGTGRNCFSAEEEHSVAFAWWVPVDHGNEIQTDSASFALSFYTEQCRHNDGSGMATEASVNFEDQESDGSSVVVDSVTLPEGGYVVIHESDGGAPGPVLGNSSYLPAGTSSDVTVTLDSPISGSQELIAMAHKDDGDQQYEFPNADGPYTKDGSAVIDAAQITVST